MTEEIELDQNKVYFSCKVCGYLFEEDPDLMPIRCPQCDSEDTEKV